VKRNGVQHEHIESEGTMRRTTGTKAGRKGLGQPGQGYVRKEETTKEGKPKGGARGPRHISLREPTGLGKNVLI